VGPGGARRGCFYVQVDSNIVDAALGQTDPMNPVPVLFS
jgi:hypothetical protein